MNLPSEFENYTRDLLGDALYSRLREGLAEAPSPTSIRLNPFKAASREVNGQLMESVVPWCPATGRYLNERPNFTFDPLFHAGAYYVQEAGSMLVDLAVRHLITQPVRMLDLCAAPGGKSTALRAALPEGSLLFTNEPMRTRVQILSENIQKFGHEDVIVTNNYPRDYRKARIMFDATASLRR
jgi:16S rRNA C967 or C1407 C5-methylase (RsmB/RsmF family)